MAVLKLDNLVRNRTLLIVSVALGVLAVLLVNLYVHGVESRLMRGSFIVLQAATDLKPGEKIKATSIRKVEVPGRFQQAFAQAWKGMDADALIGRAVAVEVKEGEILFHSQFEAHRGATPADTIPPGFGHWGIRLDSRSAPASLQPGDVVDLVASVRLTADSAPAPVTVMRGVKVVALGSLMSAPDNTASVRRSDISRLTIEITPDEATKLQAVENNMDGDYRVMVRNPRDRAYDPTNRLDPRLRPLFSSLRPGTDSER